MNFPIVTQCCGWSLENVYENTNALSIRQETKGRLRQEKRAGDNQLSGNHLWLVQAHRSS